MYLAYKRRNLSEQCKAYHTLLETAKPYLIMPVRIPALQCSLLFSSEIDTSGSCNTIVTDKWIEYRIHEVSFGENFVFFFKNFSFFQN